MRAQEPIVLQCSKPYSIGIFYFTKHTYGQLGVSLTININIFFLKFDQFMMYNKIVFTVGYVLKFKKKYNKFNFWVGDMWCHLYCY